MVRLCNRWHPSDGRCCCFRWPVFASCREQWAASNSWCAPVHERCCRRSTGDRTAPGSFRREDRSSSRGNRTDRSSAADRCATRSNTALRRSQCSRRSDRPGQPVGRRNFRSSSHSAGSCDARTRMLMRSRSSVGCSGMVPCSGKLVDRTRSSMPTSSRQTRGRPQRRIRRWDRSCSRLRIRTRRHNRRCSPARRGYRFPAFEIDPRSWLPAPAAQPPTELRAEWLVASQDPWRSAPGARRERRIGRKKSAPPIAACYTLRSMFECGRIAQGIIVWRPAAG